MIQSDRNCADCGAPLTPGSTCPSCLFLLGIESPTVRPPVDSAGRRYDILSTLGEGGMGTVYLAEQNEPIRRRVALKVIKRGMDSDQVIVRFEAERQAIALMDHPAIATIYEAGQMPSGQPFFSMEYVEGDRITDHADRTALSTRERLDLFCTLCDGVHHAHQKGIIHRDLKPSNVLVASNGETLPKIIDFGVAKATAGRLTDETMVTELGVVVGTPQYMSPEQAGLSPLGIDTRTDVYSLGVTLYEMLSGCLPFESGGAGLHEIRRRIREDEPATPSSRVRRRTEHTQTIARQRRVDVPTLHRELNGDLDWITMKALAKEPERRYASAAELAADIRRHLEHEPVLARPASTGYRLRKFARRHRAGVAVTGTALLVLIGFAVAMTVQTARIARERDRSERVAVFLGEMLRNVEPDEMGVALLGDLGRRVEELHVGRGAGPEQVEAALRQFRASIAGINPTQTARRLLDTEVLATAGATISAELASDPGTAATLRLMIGHTYLQLGLLDKAEVYIRDALSAQERLHGRDHPETLEAILGLGNLLVARGRLMEAERLHREALDGYRRARGNLHPATLTAANDLGALLRDLGSWDEAEQLLREAIDGRTRLHGTEHRETLVATENLATLLVLRGELDEAERLQRESLDGYRRVLGDHHPATLRSVANMGNLLSERGKLDEADELFRQALDEARSALGDDHPDTLSLVASLGAMARLHRRLDEAEALTHEALEGRRRLLGDDHPRTLDSIHQLGKLEYERGHAERSVQHERQVLDGRRRVLGDDHPDTVTSINSLGVLLWRLGKLGEAEPYLVESLDARIRILGSDHPDTLIARNNLAMLLWGLGRLEEAETQGREGLEGHRRRLGDDHPDTVKLTGNLGYLLQAQGKLEEADRYFRQALDGYQHNYPEQSDWVCYALAAVGHNLELLGRYGEAESVLREALDLHLEVHPEGHWLIANTSSYLGAALAGQKKYLEAEPLLLQGYTSMDPPAGQDKYRAEALERIVNMYEAWGKSFEADRWRARAAAPGS